MIFRLRHGTADSPPCPAESDSLSYGLPFRFQLLSTPFRNDAVTFSYDVMAYADRDFHPVVKLPLWAHNSRQKYAVAGLQRAGSETLFTAIEKVKILALPLMTAFLLPTPNSDPANLSALAKLALRHNISVDQTAIVVGGI